MMKTSTDKNPAEFIEDVINSYETHIKNIEAVFSTSEAVNDSSHLLFDNLNRTIIELNEERLQLNSKLRDTLAKNGSLRKNDYDKHMDEIFQVLRNMENEAKNSFSGYLQDQKAMVKMVRENILVLKNKENQTQKDLIREFKKELEQIVLAQQRGKELVITNFIRLQNMHNKLAQHFKQLLSKQKDVNSKDIKDLKNILLNEQN